MKTILIACSMMEDEPKRVFDQTGCKIETIWIEKGYHNTPDKLKEKLQEEINRLQEYDEILLAFGLCGNGTEGIVSSQAKLIIPKFDDCINLMLCDGKRKTRALAEAGAIYLTRGWMEDQESILSKHKEMVNDYDEETAQDILEMMYGHYERLVIIDTDSYDLKETQEYAEEAAKLLDFRIEQTSGSTKILEQLVMREWDENFIIQEPGQPLTVNQWNM